MKIVFLNVWNAHEREPLFEFIREQARDTDIFCLQEAYPNTQHLFQDSLFGFRLTSAYKFIVTDEDFAQATYVREGLEQGTPEIIFGRESARCGLGICTPVRFGSGVLSVINFHGLSKPGAKKDDPDRLAQSKGLIEFMAKKPGPKIIGGDFNLMPDTESVRMFAGNGYRDLIADFKIPTTRNHLVWDKYPDSKQYFSDYIFVSPEIKVRRFSVPRNEISDHLPMIIDISI